MQVDKKPSVVAPIVALALVATFAVAAPAPAQAGLILSEISTGQAVAAPWYTAWWAKLKGVLVTNGLILSE